MRKSLELPIKLGEELIEKWAIASEKGYGTVLFTEEEEFEFMACKALEAEFGESNEYVNKFRNYTKEEKMNLKEPNPVYTYNYRVIQRRVNLLKFVSHLP